MADRLVVNDDSVNFSSKRQKRNKISKQTATILILAATIMAVCAAGTLYGIHRHKVKILAAQKAELQRQMEEEELARQKAIEDSIARVNFQTPDLKMVGAHGPVKSIEYKDKNDPVLCMNENPIIFTFGEDGLIDKIIYSGNKDLTIKRNSKSQIEEISQLGGRCVHQYVYGNDDYVKVLKQELSYQLGTMSYMSSCKWDESGKLLSKNSKLHYGDVSHSTIDVEETSTYDYQKTDEYGNWIECKVKTETIKTVREQGITRESNIRNSDIVIITRTIDYY